MKVTIVLGSVREGRQTHRAAYYVERQLKENGVDADLIDLAEDQLPILGFESDDSKDGKRIKKISERLDKSDGLIFVTPEYQTSFSGVIKNAIDHYYPEFQKKPIGIVAASAGNMAGINAASQLQQVILGLGGFPLPLNFLVPRVHEAFNDSFEPQNEQIVKSAGAFLDEFLWFTEAITEKKKSKTKKRPVTVDEVA